jgi:hypothetical protein
VLSAQLPGYDDYRRAVPYRLLHHSAWRRKKTAWGKPCISSIRTGTSSRSLTMMRPVDHGIHVRRAKLENLQEPIVIVPIIDWSSIAENGLRFAMTLSSEVEVLHIESEDTTKSLKRIWPTRVEERAREAKQAVRC